MLRFGGDWWYMRLVACRKGGGEKSNGIHIEDVGNFKKIVLRDIYGSGAPHSNHRLTPGMSPKQGICPKIHQISARHCQGQRSWKKWFIVCPLMEPTLKHRKPIGCRIVDTWGWGCCKALQKIPDSGIYRITHFFPRGPPPQSQVGGGPRAAATKQMS